MDKLERFKQLSDSMPTEQKVELYQQFVASPEAGIERIIELAAAEGLQLDKAEVSELIKAIDVENEFDDVELDAVALATVACGWSRLGGCCAMGSLPRHSSDAQMVIWPAACRSELISQSTEWPTHHNPRTSRELVAQTT